MYREQTGRERPARADAEYRRLLDEAYFDTAPSYNNGQSETNYGRVLDLPQRVPGRQAAVPSAHDLHGDNAHPLAVSGGQQLLPDPIPMSGIRVAVAGDFRSAHAVHAGEALPVTHRDGASEFTLPALAMYELVELGASS
jgi:hypothetical protein